MADITPMTPADMSAVLGNRWGYPYGGSGFGFGGGDGGLFAILLIVLLLGGGAWGMGNRGQFGTEALVVRRWRMGNGQSWSIRNRSDTKPNATGL